MKNNIILQKDVKDFASSNKQIKSNKASVSVWESHRHVFIGPSNVGKTCYKMELLEKKVTKDMFL